MVYILVGSTLATSPTGLYNLNGDNSLVFVKTLNGDGIEDSTNASWIVSSQPGHSNIIFSTNETRGSVQMHEIIKCDDDLFLKLRCSLSTGGRGTTHLALGGIKNDVLIASSYDSGSVSVFSVNCETSFIQGPVQIVDQNKPTADASAHAHQCVTNGTVAYVCDLGNNAVYTYNLSNAHQPLSVLGELQLPVGCGPRHLVVNAAGTWAYVLNELSSEVVAVRIDPATLVLLKGDTAKSCVFSMLPAGVSAEGMAGAAILLSDDGRFLYVSNRDISPITAADLSTDRSSISVFSIDGEGESLCLIQTVGSRGRHPRHMALLQTTTGPVLLVANRDTQNFVVFPVDAISGTLVEDRAVVSLADPQCKDPGFVMQI